MKDCNNFSERLLQPTIQMAFKRTAVIISATISMAIVV